MLEKHSFHFLEEHFGESCQEGSDVKFKLVILFMLLRVYQSAPSTELDLSIMLRAVQTKYNLNSQATAELCCLSPTRIKLQMCTHHRSGPSQQWLLYSVRQGSTLTLYSKNSSVMSHGANMKLRTHDQASACGKEG